MLRTRTSIAALSILLLSFSIVVLVVAYTNKQPGIARESSSLQENSRGPSDGWRLYDPEPNHIWNRLYRSLYLRTDRDGTEYGYDELDPLLWPPTKYLLTNPAYQQTIAVLNEFLSSHAEKQISDPLKRAILQRDLWAVFDWTTRVQNDSPQKFNLQVKLVEVMKRIALSPEQIANLPSTYTDAIQAKTFATAYNPANRETAFIPANLFSLNGPWVSISARGGWSVARTHIQEFSGRSVFLVFANLPQGRDATLKYFQALSEFSRPWLADAKDPERLLPNPELPQFPAGTQLVLVREMALIDNLGNFRPTNIVEDIQIRLHRTVPEAIPISYNTDHDEAREALDGYEFKLSRPKLFAGVDGGLRRVARDETEFPLFMSHGIDVFEVSTDHLPLKRVLRTPLQMCSNCHFRPGIHAMLSRRREGVLPSWDSNYEADNTKYWKATQFNWGLLQGLWKSH